jgi:hypothetical protein
VDSDDDNGGEDTAELLSSVITTPTWSHRKKQPRAKKKMLTFRGTINGKSAWILLDTGSSHDFISEKFVEQHRLSVSPTTSGQKVTLADGSGQTPKGRVPRTQLNVGEHNYIIDFTVLPLSRYDAILGMDFMQKYQPRIHWSTLAFEPTMNVHTSTNLSYSPPEVLNVDGQVFVMINDENDGQEDAETDDPGCTKLVKEFDELFEPMPAGLPPQRTADHRIELVPGSIPPSRSSYRMSSSELEALRKQLHELLEQGKIQPSKSPYGAPVLFVKKKSGELRLCVDYRALNKQTVRNTSQMPRQDELLDRLRGSRFFTKMDMRSGYHLVRVHPDDVHKTAFNTRYGHYEWNVLPFGLTNAPATFQTLMNEIFADFIDVFVIVYLDDILIFSNTIEEHRVHVRQVLERLRKHSLYANREKCEFGRKSIQFLGHIISQDGISMEPSKLNHIRDWPVPKSIEDIRSFLGLTGYYRRFIHKFSHIAAPLSNLTRKNARFLWTTTEQKAFDELKTAMTTGPVLIVPDDSLPFTVTTDASNYAVGAALSQDQGHGLQPVAFMSHRMSPAQSNYPTHEQELLAVIRALSEWRHYLDGRRFTIITDHHSLTYLQTQPKLSKRQVRWITQLADFDFDIVYRPGKDNVVADALSRRPDHRVSDDKEDQSYLAGLNLHQLHIGGDLLEEIRRAYVNDPECAAALKNPSTSVYKIRHGLLYRPDDRLRIPKDDSIKGTLLFEAHDSILCGHVGVNKTARMVGQLFDWPNLRQDVRQYVSTCVGCQANKASNQKPIGLMQPLPIPTRRWETVTMDLITHLPMSRQQNDAIIVFVDKLSKMVHYAACKTTVTAPEVARIFFQQIVRHHGVPNAIVSDRDPRFVSHFWQSLWKELGSKLKMSTAYHPQTDGQTERSNRTLEDMLRAYVNYAQDDWDEKLVALEIAVNNNTQDSTGFTPFYLNSGQHPHFPLSMLIEKSDNEMAQTMLRTLRDHIEQAKQHLLAAQQRQSQYADESKREFEFKIGDQVMLSTENMNVGERARKLCAKFAGPHKIIAHPTANTYRLDLPPELSRLYPVFNSSTLKAFKSDEGRFANRPQINRPPAIIDAGKEQYMIEAIQAYRVRRGVGYFLVKWQGYGDSESSWRPITEVNAPHLVERFLRENPTMRAEVNKTKTIRIKHSGRTVREIKPTVTTNIQKRTTKIPKPMIITEPVRRSQRQLAQRSQE